MRAEVSFRGSYFFLFLILATVLIVSPLQAQNAGLPVSPSPAASPSPGPGQTWRVGFLRLAAGDLSDAYSFLTASVPRTWRIALNEGFRHRVSKEEADALQLDIDRKAMASALKTLEAAYTARDRAWLENGEIPDDKAKSLQTTIDKAIIARSAYVDLEPLSDEVKAAIKAKAADLRLLYPAPSTTPSPSPSPSPGASPLPGTSPAPSQNPFASPSPAPVASPRPAAGLAAGTSSVRGGRGPLTWIGDTFAKIEIAAAGQETDLYEAVAPEDRANMRRVAATQNLQSLVGGRLSEQQGYLFLELFVYDAATDSIAFSDQRAFAPGDIQDRSPEFLDDIATAILGFKTATVRVHPALGAVNSRLVGPLDKPVNGRDEGLGVREWRYLEPGMYRLEYFAAGYYNDSETFELQQGDVIDRSPKLTLAPYPPLHVESAPDGAEVYMESQLVGKTPLDLNVAGGSTILVLEKEGYQKQSVLVNTDEQERVDVTLRKQLIDWDKEIVIRRNGFYDALARFAFSLVVPILSEGFYRNNPTTIWGYWPGSSVISVDDYLNLWNQAQAFNIARYGGIVISVVAFVDGLIKLDYYLRAADYVAGHQ